MLVVGSGGVGSSDEDQRGYSLGYNNAPDFRVIEGCDTLPTWESATQFGQPQPSGFYELSNSGGLVLSGPGININNNETSCLTQEQTSQLSVINQSLRLRSC